jgi:hypothetical protein
MTVVGRRYVHGLTNGQTLLVGRLPLPVTDDAAMHQLLRETGWAQNVKRQVWERGETTYQQTSTSEGKMSHE